MASHRFRNKGDRAYSEPVPSLLARATDLLQRGAVDQAETLYRRVLAADKRNFDALHLLGLILAQRGKPAEAQGLLAEAVRARPRSVEAQVNLARVLTMLDRHAEALAGLDAAVALDPTYVLALNNRGAALRALGRLDEAVASYNAALALKPDYVDALYNCGNALNMLERYDEALASFDRALALRPSHAGTLIGRANALRGLRRFDDAAGSLDRALALEAGNALALFNRGNILSDGQRYEEAVASYERVLALDPGHRYALGGLAFGLLSICDWGRSESRAAEVETQVRQGKSVVQPFTFLAASGDAALQRRCAEAFIRDKTPVRPPPLWRGETWHHDRIRVAYLSADFRDHAMSYLIANLLELHDRARFEIVGVSLGVDDGSVPRSRIVKAMDQFHDVQSRSDREVAGLLHELKVDVLVDLNGYTLGGRPEILGYRPSPVQMSYLGFPGTSGTDFIDYMIADEIVLPPEQQSSFTEKIIYLPDSYWVNDSNPKSSARVPTRREAGLPDAGLVFCCFNNNYKIRPFVFDVWMRLLRAVEGSVLWLRRTNATAERNLRQAAQARGIAPHRLVFAEPVAAAADHLARHRLADVFLDTLPVNAHTTATDALWMGVPVVTCCGSAFAGRVAASLVAAAGVPELAVASLEEYEALALKIATEPRLLTALQTKLRQNRRTCRLFDTDRFRRHIETAYVKAWEIWQRGGKPEGFRVEAIGE